MKATDIINDQSVTINPKLKTALNRFFKEYDSCLEFCILRKDWDGAPYALIIEESDLYYHLQGEYGWTIHTAFHEAFKGTGYHPEMINSCVVGFYKD